MNERPRITVVYQDPPTKKASCLELFLGAIVFLLIALYLLFGG